MSGDAQKGRQLLEAELEQLRSRLDASLAEGGSALKSVSEEHDRLVAQLAQSQAHKEELSCRVEDLEKQLEALRLKLASTEADKGAKGEAEDKLASSKAEIKNMTARVAKLEGEHLEAVKVLKNQHKDIIASTARQHASEIEELKSRLSKAFADKVAEGEAAQQTRDKRGGSKALDTARKQLSEKDKTIMDLNDEIAKWKQLASEISELQAEREEFQNTKTELQAERKKRSQLEAERKQRLKEVAGLRKELSEAQRAAAKTLNRSSPKMALPVQAPDTVAQKRKRKSEASFDDDVMVRERYLSRRRTHSGSAPGWTFQQVKRWVGGYDDTLCWDFQRRGVCPRGARCKWKHPGARPEWVAGEVKDEPEE
jgi:chromosome segregation ATPase